MPRLLLVNGLPGSGKTTISRLLRDALQPAIWIDTDDLMHARPWSSEEQRYIDTLRRGLLVAQDCFTSGIPTVILAGCIHSKELFGQLAETIDLQEIQCTVIALLADPAVRKERQTLRGKQVDVGTDDFHLAAKDVAPATMIHIESSAQTPEETIHMILGQLPG